MSSAAKEAATAVMDKSKEVIDKSIDKLENMKDKFLSIIKKKKPSETASALPVRVNLPSELGGGFTMLMCFMKNGQNVSDFTKNLISMLQNTNSYVLRSSDYGLTPHIDRDEEGRDEDGNPPVFLKPDSLLADAYDDEVELNLDLRRLKPKSKSDESSSSGNSDANGATKMEAAKPFRMPTLPVPPSQHILHYTALSKLKRLKAPANPPPEVIFLTNSVATPCSLPAHLARSLPQGMGIGALNTSLLARSSAQDPNAASSSSSVPSTSPNGTTKDGNASDGPVLSKSQRKEAEKAQKKLTAFASVVFDQLVARGIGEDPLLKLQMASAMENHASGASSIQKGERIGTSAAASGARMWGGWDEQVKKPSAATDSVEIALVYVSAKKLPDPVPKKMDVTTDCFVVTNKRCLQIENGSIVEELALGSESGNTLKLPKETDDGEEGWCPINLIVKNVQDVEREEILQEAAARGDDVQQLEDDLFPEIMAEDPEMQLSARQRRRKKLRESAQSKLLTFHVPNPDVAGFIEEYLMYFQEKCTLEAQLGLIEQARLDRVEHYMTERCLRGWTYLLKSLVGPLIFGPLRQPVYENTIKQALAKVLQMDIKQVKITSLKLLEFKIPELDPTKVAPEGSSMQGEGDQIPALRLASYVGHPAHEYTFDIYWSAPDFCIKLEISGKKIVSFALQLEMRGIEVKGSLRLRSSPYEPEKAAVSFVSVPQLSFGVGSHVIVGSIKLPFQRAIEKIIYTQIQAAIESGLKDNVVGDKWQSINFEKSGLSLQLDRWWGIAQYPFKYDGTDDEDMMSLALVVTTQAEKSLSDTVKEMRSNMNKMQKYLGHVVIETGQNTKQ